MREALLLGEALPEQEGGELAFENRAVRKVRLARPALLPALMHALHDARTALWGGLWWEARGAHATNRPRRPRRADGKEKEDDEEQEEREGR